MSAEIKFEVDFMLGKLATALRMLGFNTKYVKYKKSEAILSDSLKENRILLTRAHNLPENPNIFIIESENLDQQLKEVDSKFKIKSKLKPFTRCLICNTSLEVIPKSKVKGKVPFYVYQTHQEFAYCKECHKFYWKGTHYQAMLEKIRKLNNS
ncbi:Mut7-C RNAse domain-containing protein [candidate division WOR-3 bacterium]|nr:Mut7-C RNAse domain-containing protein [candidate division WOR-3 bacterium]